MPEVLSVTPENLSRAAEVLRRGGLVGMPTETVYGLAGLAFDAAAVTRIFGAKERPTFDPLIVHVAERSWLPQVIDDAALDEKARRRLDALAPLWPGPLTVVAPRGPRVPDLVTSGLPTVAVRAPAHPAAQALLAELGAPLAAPSANRFGRISPTRAEDVVAELGDRVDLVLDGGPCTVGVESTIVWIQGESPALLRPGAISRARLEELLGEPVVAARRGDGAAQAPGMLPSHYAPRKPLVLLDMPVTDLELPEHIGLLVFSGDVERAAARLGELTGRPVTARVLSPSGDLAEAARNLFASLRALDDSPATVILAEPCPTDEGLGHAIRDRLVRAAGRG